MTVLNEREQAEANGEVRRLEKNADELMSALRYLEDAEDTSDLDEAGRHIVSVISFLADTLQVLRQLHWDAEQREEAEAEAREAEGVCPECGAPVFDLDFDHGYCGNDCADRNR